MFMYCDGNLLKTMIYIEIFLSSAYLFLEIVTLLYTVSQKNVPP